MFYRLISNNVEKSAIYKGEICGKSFSVITLLVQKIRWNSHIRATLVPCVKRTSSGIRSITSKISESMGTVQPGNPKARRKAIWVILFATFLGFSAILAFECYQHDFQSWLERNIDFLLENTFVVFVVSLILVSPVLAAGTYLLLLGNRTVRAQRFPPLGYAVVSDTLVLEGWQGVRRGRVIQLLSVFLLCSAGAIPVVMWYIFHTFGSAT